MTGRRVSWAFILPLPQNPPWPEYFGARVCLYISDEEALFPSVLRLSHLLLPHVDVRLGLWRVSVGEQSDRQCDIVLRAGQYRVQALDLGPARVGISPLHRQRERS